MLENIDNDEIRDNILWYFNRIDQCQVNSYEDELVLFKKYRDGDINSKNKIIENNLGLVVSIAKNYVSENNFLQFTDLIQEGNMGLLKAIESFDYTKGYKFSTYATFCIKSVINQSLIDYNRTIKLSTAIYNEIVNLNKVIGSLKKSSNADLTTVELANASGYSISKISELLLNKKPLFRLNNLIHYDNKTEYIEIIPSPVLNPHEILIKKMLQKSIWKLLDECNLTSTEIKILNLKYGLVDGKELNYSEIGKQLNIHKNVVRDIELRVLKKIRSCKNIQNILGYVVDEDKALKNIRYFKKMNYKIIGIKDELNFDNVTMKELKVKRLIYKLLYNYTSFQREKVLATLLPDEQKLINYILLNESYNGLTKEQVNEVATSIYSKINKNIKNLKKVYDKNDDTELLEKYGLKK